MYSGILIKLKVDIFRRNSIFNPVSNDQIAKYKIRFLYQGAVPGYGIKLFVF
jgi:hypothetical protein